MKRIALGPVDQSPIKLILGEGKFYLLDLFSAKGRFATKFWPNNIIKYKFLFLKPYSWEKKSSFNRK